MAATKTRHRKKHHRVRHRKKHHHNPKMRHRVRHHHAMRHHARRRHHRNPFSGGSGSVWGQIGMGVAGLVATRIVGNFAYNMIVPAAYQGPMAKIATKGLVIFGIAWGAGKMFGQAAFRPLLIGGAMDVIEDLLVNYVTPSFPLLSAYPGLQTGALSAYPGMSGYRQQDNSYFGGNDEM